MARPKSNGPLTPLELEIMKVLWEVGAANVQTVHDGLPKERKLTYSSVQTMLNLLVKKGKVTRQRDGRAFFYRPVLERSSAVRLALKDIIDRFFKGSAEDLVLGLIETSQLEPEKLSQLQKLGKRAKEKKHGDD